MNIKKIFKHNQQFKIVYVKGEYHLKVLKRFLFIPYRKLIKISDVIMTFKTLQEAQQFINTGYPNLKFAETIYKEKCNG